MSLVPSRLTRYVQDRAGNRCEYCQLSQTGQEATFHVDHIVPVSAKGPSVESNLALACVSCSLRKGARQFAPDPNTGLNAPLFNPRQHVWADHFRWDGLRIVGITATGRATAVALLMNRPLILSIREEERIAGRHLG